jgi:hypothetical protein
MLADAIDEDWEQDDRSGKIIRVNFTGKATQRFMGDGKRACDIYGNLATELYFACADFARNRRLAGMHIDAIRQFCRRRYSRTRHSGKIVLMSKEDYRKEFGHSPNHADAVAVAVEAARNRVFVGEDARQRRRRSELDFEERMYEAPVHEFEEI